MNSMRLVFSFYFKKERIIFYFNFQSEDKADALSKELLSTKTMLIDTEEEKKRLEIEVTQVKEMCCRELQRAESDNNQNAVIIADYIVMVVR